MKRMFPLFLVLCLLLSGCGLWSEGIKEPVTFYYLRSEIPYGTAEGILAPEEREASGHRDNLPYLLALYCMGPSGEDLRSPIPMSTRIDSAKVEDGQVLLTLTDTYSNWTDANFTLACACLTMTCLDLTEANAVTITCGERTVTMSRDNLVFFDSGSAAETEATS